FDRMPDKQKKRLKLFHGSLTYRDKRLTGYDAAAVLEVIEHLDPERLTAFERILFEITRPNTIIITTPNSEYNVRFENIPPSGFRHRDHRFEWTREEFEAWANNAAKQYGYSVCFEPVGPEYPEIGAPTQMGIFAVL
ncbi:MAG: 3' terminal RNA ribose 2'-O-methyltransferase Hen1, partial [Desulfobacteraceae bacterium]|nr:3' terminal RNA ribose 2'-O-methyltransferase Hen1 [Desulfobacteraceae bacterium]